MTKKPLIQRALAALWIIALLLFAGQGFSLAAQSKTLTIAALKGPTGIGMVRVFEAPPALPDSYQLHPLAVASADLMAAKVISGEYDAAVLPINMAAKLYNSGVPIRLAAIVGDGMVRFLSSDASIVSLASLKGKTVSVAGQGATPDFVFRALLKSAGLDPDKDLHLSYALPYPEAAAAVASGAIPSALLPEPFATQALLANPALRTPFDIGALWKGLTGQASYPMSAFVVSADLAARSPASVAVLMKAYRDSIAWVVANPAAAGILVEKNDLGLKAEVARDSIPRSNFVFVPARQSRPAVEALLSVFLAIAPVSVGGALPNAGFYASFD